VAERIRRSVPSLILGALVAVLAGAVGWCLATRRARDALRASARSIEAELEALEEGLRVAEVAIRREGPNNHCGPLVGAVSRGQLAAFKGRIEMLRSLQADLDNDTDADWLGDVWRTATAHENQVVEGLCASWVHGNPADPNYRRPGWE